MKNAFRRTTEAKERSAVAAKRIAAAQEKLVQNFDAFAEILDGIDSQPGCDAPPAGNRVPRKPEGPK